MESLYISIIIIQEGCITVGCKEKNCLAHYIKDFWCYKSWIRGFAFPFSSFKPINFLCKMYIL